MKCKEHKIRKADVLSVEEHRTGFGGTFFTVDGEGYCINCNCYARAREFVEVGKMPLVAQVLKEQYELQQQRRKGCPEGPASDASLA